MVERNIIMGKAGGTAGKNRVLEHIQQYLED